MHKRSPREGKRNIKNNGRRTRLKLAALQSAFGSLSAELQELSPSDRQLLMDGVFLSVSGAIAQARTCVAGLVCSKTIARNGAKGYPAATQSFFERFREAWAVSVLAHSRFDGRNKPDELPD